MFYPADWLTDNVSGLSLAAQGLWLRMMIVMHSAERRGYLVMNGRPMTDEFIAAKCGCDVAAYRSLLGELSHAGVPRRTSDEIIYNKRMVEDERIRQEGRRRVQKHRSNALRNASVTPSVTSSPEYEYEDEDTEIIPVIFPAVKPDCAKVKIQNAAAFNSTEMARIVWERLDLSGDMMMMLCRDAIDRAMNRKNLTAEQAGELVESQWRLYESLKRAGKLKYPCGIKGFLENGKHLETREQ